MFGLKPVGLNVILPKRLHRRESRFKKKAITTHILRTIQLIIITNTNAVLLLTLRRYLRTLQ